MLQLYELTAILTKLAFCATFLVNLLFINLTISYTQNIIGTYRKMLVTFAITCTIFSAIELIAQPSIHNFNAGFLFFSLNETSVFSQDALRMSLVIYASCYVSQLVFIAIQFLFRYFTLIQHPLRKSFQGRQQILWILYFLVTGFIYGLLGTTFLQSDAYSDEYMREEMRRVYARDIRDTPRILAVAYENGRVRGSVVVFLLAASLIIGLQYAIVIVCSLKMQIAMNTELSNLSTRNRTLERQFFKALTVQILLPTLLLTVPIGFVLLVPLLDIEISCQTGVIYALYSLYPPLDSIATMVIIDEYKCCLRSEPWWQRSRGYGRLLALFGDFKQLLFKKEDAEY